MSTGSEVGMDWLSLRREDWQAVFDRYVANAENGELRMRLAPKTVWEAILTEAEATIIRLLHDNQTFATETIEEIVDSHIPDKGVSYFPVHLMTGKLVEKYCQHRIEIAEDFSEALLETVASFLVDAGLLGGVAIEQDDNESTVLHCSDPVAAVTLRLRFG